MYRRFALPVPLLAAIAVLAPASSACQEPGEGSSAAREALLLELARAGVLLDIERGLIQLDGRICQVYEPLEYLVVVAGRGKEHEALVKVDGVSATALNTAMKLTGVVEGRNGRFIPRDPPLTEEEYAAGELPYRVEPASGDGFYLYLAWEQDSGSGGVERRFYRAEDLVLNVRGDRTYQRGRWVYLGSRFVKPHRDAPEMFAAEAEGNLVSLVYFDPANHLLTGADAEADNQYIWYPNVFLLPELGHPVKLLLSRDQLDWLPDLLEKPAPDE